MNSTTIFIFTLALFSLLISMPTVESFGSSQPCFIQRFKKGKTNPRLIPSNGHVEEKENYGPPPKAKSIDEDDAIPEGKTNDLRSKDSARKSKKVKLNVDVNINLGKH